MQPLDIALSYIKRGWPCFPCRHADETTDNFDPETGEVEVLKVKTPITSNGFKAATRFKHILERWWRDNPDAMIGVPTGAQINAWVLDIDPRHNGNETLAALETEYGDLPATLTATTASGGKHFYFRHMPGVRNRGNLGPGIDVRGDGGYVIAPGSVTAAGGRYEWDNDLEPVDAPSWLLDLVVRREQPVTVHHGTAHTNSAYVNAAVDRELSELAGEPMGNRNNRLNDAAFSLGTFVGAGALAESEARALLQDVARSWGRDWARCAKTIENGLAAGKRSPRDIPQPEQDNTRLIDISRMIENGLRKAKKKGGQSTAAMHENGAQHDLTPRARGNDPESAPPASGTTPADEPAQQDNQPQAEQPALLATPFTYKDPRTLPRREFAFGTHYIRKYVSVTVAPGGLGKTALAIMEALSMTSGKPLAGTKPPEPLRAWIFNSEDPRDEMERRIMAACIRYKLKPADTQGLFLDTGREQELVVMREDRKSGLKVNEPIVEAVVEQIRRNSIDVMIVDPFVSTHQVNENDNGAIDKVAKLWAQIADQTNCAIDIVHHLRKLADREATVEDARGAVSLIGAARSVRVLNRMSADQAKDAGLEEGERYSHFSINHGKANLAPLSHKLEWRRLEGVPLGNGRGLTKPQDFAPVVMQWKWPSAEEMVSAVSDEQRGRIVSLLAGQSYKAARQGKPWAGEAIMAAFDMDADDKASQRRAGAILKAMLAEGVLKVEERRDEYSRGMQKFVVAA